MSLIPICSLLSGLAHFAPGFAALDTAKLMERAMLMIYWMQPLLSRRQSPHPSVQTTQSLSKLAAGPYGTIVGRLWSSSFCIVSIDSTDTIWYQRLTDNRKRPFRSDQKMLKAL